VAEEDRAQIGAEKYYVDVKPLLVKAGRAQG
jgi:hypothetical protein